MRDTSQELKSLRDMANSAGQLSAAISAEVKREELRRFYVKQIEPVHVNELSKMSDGELQRFIRETDALIRSMAPSVPPAGRHSGSCINSAWRSGCSGDHLISLRITCCAHLFAERSGVVWPTVPPSSARGTLPKSRSFKDMFTRLWLFRRVQSRRPNIRRTCEHRGFISNVIVHKLVAAPTLAVADRCHTIEARRVSRSDSKQCVVVNRAGQRHDHPHCNAFEWPHQG